MKALIQAWVSSWFSNRDTAADLSGSLRTPPAAQGAARAESPPAAAPEPDPATDLQAVCRDGLSIAAIPAVRRTPAVCLAAVQQNGRAIQHLSPGQRTLEVRMAAVRRSGFALHYLLPEERTPEVCLAAVMQDGWVIEMLQPEQRTPQVCLAAIEKTPQAVRFLTEQELGPEVCLAAITRNRLTARQLPVAQMLRPPMSHWIRNNWTEVSRLVDPSNLQLLQIGLELPVLRQEQGGDSGLGAFGIEFTPDAPGRRAVGGGGVGSSISPLPPPRAV